MARYPPTTYYINSQLSADDLPVLEKAQQAPMPTIPDGGLKAWATVAGACVLPLRACARA